MNLHFPLGFRHYIVKNVEHFNIAHYLFLTESHPNFPNRLKVLMEVLEVGGGGGGKEGEAASRRLRERFILSLLLQYPHQVSSLPPPPQIPEVGAERILDTVEQIRLKYVPSLVFVTLCDWDRKYVWTISYIPKMWDFAGHFSKNKRLVTEELYFQFYFTILDQWKIEEPYVTRWVRHKKTGQKFSISS